MSRAKGVGRGRPAKSMARQLDQQMVDAIREMLGIGALYAPAPSKVRLVQRFGYDRAWSDVTNPGGRTGVKRYG